MSDGSLTTPCADHSAGASINAAPAAVDRREASLWQMIVYAQGDCAISLVMNGVFGFAMLFYTKALGLNPAWAGVAMSVSVFWEAFTEPVMGHISDNTRSRWGRRHAYMLFGGLLMAVCSFLIWDVPTAIDNSQMDIFWYLLTMNILLRSGLTLFFIPYMALGFEICQDYHGRARLQGIRQIFNMAANFAGPAMAWSIFFRRNGNVHASAVAANYLHMGIAFAAATGIFVLVVVFFTYHWHEDTRHAPKESDADWLTTFVVDMKHILSDANSRWVYLFVFIICTGMVLVSSLQMFVYVDFMKLTAIEKTIAQGATMIGMALGAGVSVSIVRLLDKKGAAIAGGLTSICANALLAVFFLTGMITPRTVWYLGGHSIPIALIAFVTLGAVYWFGNGIMLPLSASMIADVSALHTARTGINKDGGYSAVYSLMMRIAIATSLMASGYCLSLIGYKTALEGRHVAQNVQTLWNLAGLMFGFGIVMAAIAIVVLSFYRVNNQILTISGQAPE